MAGRASPVGPAKSGVGVRRSGRLWGREGRRVEGWPVLGPAARELPQLTNRSGGAFLPACAIFSEALLAASFNADADRWL